MLKQSVFISENLYISTFLFCRMIKIIADNLVFLTKVELFPVLSFNDSF